MDNFWSAVMGGAIAILGSVATPICLERNKRRAERLNLTSAIVGEIQALIIISQQRKYVEGLRQVLARAEANPTIHHFFHFSVRRNPMRVYDANLARIGILPDPLPRQIVVFYAGVASILEDIEDMRDGKFLRTGEDQIRFLKGLLKLFEDTLVLGQKIIDDARF